LKLKLRPQPALIVSFLALFLLSWVLAHTSLASILGIQDWDSSLIRGLRSSTAQLIGPHLGEAIRDFSALGSMGVLALIVILICGFLLLQREFVSAFYLLNAWLGGLLIMNLLKLFFARSRPTVVEKYSEALGYSYPSGHSMVAMVVYLSLSLCLAQRYPRRNQKLYIIASGLIITLMIGFSRVYLGVHYPSDVLGGWGFGLIFVLWLTPYFQKMHLSRQHFSSKRGSTA
jgi:undecaprenyl-diphosphatase